VITKLDLSQHTKQLLK